MLDQFLDKSDAFNRKDRVEEVFFQDVWPSETQGDGRLVKNNIRSGDAQGKGSLIRKAKCQLCGFPLDLSRVDHSGGSLDGQGAGGAVTLLTSSYTYPNGTAVTFYGGQQAYRTASGCPCCFSRNSTKIRQDVVQTNPWSRLPPLGF